MPLDQAEGFAAALREVDIVQNAVQLIQALPPVTPERPRRALDFAPLFGAEGNGALYLILAEVNDPVHKAADLIPILGLKEDGVLGKQLVAFDILLADVKD